MRNRRRTLVLGLLAAATVGYAGWWWLFALPDQAKQACIGRQEVPIEDLAFRLYCGLDWIKQLIGW
jgi:hypothetical protein